MDISAMRYACRVLLLLVIVIAVPGTPAVARSSVDPQWPELLERGKVEIAVGDERYFQPVAGATQLVTAYARPTKVSSHMKFSIRVSLSWVPPEGGCRRGGIEFARKQHERAYWDEDRRLYILRARFTSDKIPRTRRFCWSTSSKTAKKYHVPKTGAQDIAFAGPLFGAHWESDLTRINLPNESYRESYKASFFRLGYGATGDVIRRRHKVFPPCQGGFGFDSTSESTLRGGAWPHRGANTDNDYDFRIATEQGCGEQIDYDFRDAPTGRGLGNLHIDTNALPGLAIPESQHAIGASCYLGNAERRAVDRAVAIVEGVGCRVGRVLSLPTDPRDPKAVPGTVWAVASHGQRAVLAPRGTSVDLYVNGEPTTTSGNPVAAEVLKRYDHGAEKGEATLRTRGPILADRPGIVLTRFFIPSKLAAGGFLHGDHRTYSDDINASHRASLLWNTATGTVVFRVTESCRTSQGRLLDLLHLDSYKDAAKYTPLVAFLKQPKCRPAFRISNASRESIFRSSDQRRFSNLAHVAATADGALSVRLSIINSYHELAQASPRRVER